jgi:hypothetical protein
VEWAETSCPRTQSPQAPTGRTGVQKTTLDQFGGTSQLAAWTLSFGTCGLACLAGAAATIFLSGDVWQRQP